MFEILPAQELSQAEKDWIAENCRPVETNMVFLLNLDRKRMDLDADPEPKGLEEIAPETEIDIRTYIEHHQLKAYGYLLLWEHLKGEERAAEAYAELDKGLNLILEAMQKEPENYDHPSEAVSILVGANEIAKAIQVLQQFVQNNPDHAEALSSLALYECLTGNTTSARTNLDKAYKLTPEAYYVYLGEMMYEMMHGIILLQQMEEEEGDMDFPINTEVLENAVKAHPDNDFPRLALHGLQVMDLMFETMINNSELLMEEKKFKFRLGNGADKVLEDAETYFSGLVASKRKNLVLPLKFLQIIEVLRSDHEAAKKWFEQAAEHPLADIDFFRVMALSAFRVTDFSAAAEYIRRGRKFKDDDEIRMLQARFHSMAGEHRQAYLTLVEAGLPTSRVALLGYFAYGIRSGAWVDVEGFRAEFASMKPEELAPEVAYYVGMAELVAGDRERAKAMLELGLKADYYAESAQEMLDHYKLN